MAAVSNEQLQAAFLLADTMSATGLDGFLRFWVIDSVPPARFVEKVRPFQLERMRRICGPVEQVAGLHEYSGPRAVWNICARGYDKTGSIARVVIWLVCYSRNPVEIVVAAGDQDQASILYDAAKREVEINPWIKPRIKFKNKRIEGATGSVVKILTADAPSSYGLRPDLIVCDELTTWEKRDLWDALFTARNKRPGSALFIISNAGILRSWQHELHLHTLADPAWSVWSTDPRTNPTWMDQEQIDRDGAMLPRAVAKRLYQNQWVDPSEEAGYLLRAEIEACLRQGADPHRKPQPMCQYVLSVDYGPRRDRTVLSLLHQDPEGVCWIDECRVLQGNYEAPVKIADVEAWLDEKLEVFSCAGLIVDPYQLEGTVQRFSERTQVTRYQARGPIGNFHMAELLRTAVLSQRLLWAPGAGVHPHDAADDFTSELSNLIIKQMPSGKYRFDHENGSHDDRAVSVGMGLVALHEGYIPRPHLVPDPVRAESQRVRGGLLVADSSRRLFGIPQSFGRNKR
jgi:hypothetical protein